MVGVGAALDSGVDVELYNGAELGGGLLMASASLVVLLLVFPPHAATTSKTVSRVALGN